MDESGRSSADSLRSRLAGGLRRLAGWLDGKAAPAGRTGLLQGIIDDLPCGVVVFDSALRYVASNRQLGELLALPEDDRAAALPDFRALAELEAAHGAFAPADPRDGAEAMVLRASRLQPCTERRPGRDGRTLDVRGAPLPGGAGMVYTYMDITEQARVEADARRNALYLRAILDQVPVGISVAGSDMRIALCNAEFGRLLDLPKELARPGADFGDALSHAAPEHTGRQGHPPLDGRMLLKHAEAGGGHAYERLHADGRSLVVRTNVLRMGGESAGLVASYLDVTDIQKRDRQLQENEIKYRSIFEAARDAMLLVDTESLYILDANQAAQELYGYGRAELVGQRIVDLSAEPRETAAGIRDEVVHVPLRYHCRSDGTVFPVEAALSHFALNGRRIHVVAVRDITTRRAMEEQLRELAENDPLTGLPNRRRFLERLAGEVERAGRYAHPLALLMIDLDHFKGINDGHGHAVGDEALKAFADVVREVVRQSDFVGRLGGEEFAIGLPHAGREGAVTTAERLRDSLRRAEVACQGGPLFLTVSIGIALFAGGETVDSMLARADTALYEAKNGGRDRAVFAA